MPQKAHAIIPWQRTIKAPLDFYTIHETTVVLYPENAHWISGAEGDRTLMLSKSQLDEIGSAAGISTVKSRPSRDGEIYSHHFVGEYEGVDGKKIRVDKWYSLDMRVKEQDGRDGGYIIFARGQARAAAEKIKKWPKKRHRPNEMPALDDDAGWEVWIENKAQRDYEMTYRHVTRKAETGAMLAAIRQACHIRGTYHEKEFELPWKIYRVDFDMARAIQAGGKMGEMAQLAGGMAIVQSLGLDPSLAKQLVEAVGIMPEALPAPNPDLMRASDEQLDELIKAMGEAGFKDMAQMDQRVIEIFEIPMSQLTSRHARIMMEYVQLGRAALENVKDKDEMAEIVPILQDTARLCYAQGTTIEDVVEERLWNKIHGIAEEEPEGTEEQDRDDDTDGEVIDGEAVTLDEAMEGKTPQAGDTV